MNKDDVDGGCPCSTCDLCVMRYGLLTLQELEPRSVHVEFVIIVDLDIGTDQFPMDAGVCICTSPADDFWLEGLAHLLLAKRMVL